MEGSPKVTAVLLAAGTSTRMGGVNKLLLPVGGMPLVRRSVETLLRASVGEVVVVLGHEAERVRAAVGALPVRCVVNAAYASGMTSSIQAGVRAAAPGAGGFLIALGDLPWLEAGEVDLLIAAFEAAQRGDPACIVVPVHRGQRGHPLVFSAVHRAALLAHTAPEGCRGLLRAHRERVVEVDMPSDHILRDVDTPAAYASLPKKGP